MSFVLNDTASAMPSYFTLKAEQGVPTGPLGHWQPEASEALQFARKEDAEHFSNYFLRNIMNILPKEI